MAEDFDPYYKWFGIPPTEQPPHYYRLLGIVLFEADPEVITNAAKQRILHVRSYQSGSYGIISQKMQQKIACAKACLLDPRKKADYDNLLRRKLSLPKTQPLPATEQSPSLSGNLPSPSLPQAQYCLELPPMVQPPPVQYANTDYCLNPIVIAKETYDWCRSHKEVVSASIKLGCVAAIVVIILMVFANAKTLWNFVFEKSSDAIAKITVSSEHKSAENVSAAANDPEIQSENTADSTGRQDGEIAKSSRSEKPSDAIPAPPNVETSSTPAAPENSQSPIVYASTESSPADTPGEVSVLNLPSEKNFRSRLFKVNINSVIDLARNSAKEDRVIFLEDPLRRYRVLAEQKSGVLDGVCVALNDNGQPRSYAIYKDGMLDGIMKTWNDKGEKVYWCQYEKGIRQGFSCYFKDNNLRLVLEMENDAIGSVHLCANCKLKKSFPSADETASDNEARQLLDALNETELDLKDDEIALKKQIKNEEQRQRRERKAPMNPQKKAAFQEQLNRRSNDIQNFVKNVWKCKEW